MGVINAATLLDEEKGAASPTIPQSELITMARQNAQRLQRTLTTLLDLAALESRNFHAQLRELELNRLVRARVEQQHSVFRDRGLKANELDAASLETMALADSQKISRAIDLCLERVLFGAKKETAIQFRISSSPAPRIGFEFELDPSAEKAWQQAWTQGFAGFQAGVGSSTSAFAGVLQSEEAFLSRTEEGLGSEFLLIHEIMRLHSGKFEQKREGSRVLLQLRFPDFSSDEALQAVLVSRAYELSNEATSVVLVLVNVPKDRDFEEFRSEAKKLLYRTTDGAYGLPHRRQVAIVMNDYRREDTLKFLERLKSTLGKNLQISMVHCPDDVGDPALLLVEAKRHLKG